MRNKKPAGITSSRGLTFIEMLMVISILAVASLAAFSAINAGIKIWQRVIDFRLDSDSALFFDNFRSDLNNIVWYEGMEMRGSDTELVFPCLLYLPDQTPKKDGPKEMLYQLGEVRYHLDPISHSVVRQERSILEVYGKRDGRIKRFFGDVVSLHMSYYFPSKIDNAWDWRSSLEDKTIPRFVKVDMLLKGKGKSRETLNGVLEVPQGAAL